MRPLADYHTHTRWSHASGSINENVAAARSLGLREVGIAEHGPNLLFVGVPRRRWRRLQAAVRSNAADDLRVLFNIEANVISVTGKLDVPRAVTGNLDKLLVGLHPRVCPADLSSWWAFYGLRYLALLSRSQRHKLWDMFTRAMVNCVETNSVDIITHPGYGLPIDTKELALACARRGTLLEINCRHTQNTARDLKIAAAVKDVRFVLGSDAHKPEQVGRFGPGLSLARELRIDSERIVNMG
ncbi:MAG: histidinol-phosphatase [Firmicutes bacterium]|nr:histidinol-phosphatase [Bacillota bacterium]